MSCMCAFICFFASLFRVFPSLSHTLLCQLKIKIHESRYILVLFPSSFSTQAKRNPNPTLTKQQCCVNFFPPPANDSANIPLLSVREKHFLLLLLAFLLRFGKRENSCGKKSWRRTVARGGKKVLSLIHINNFACYSQAIFHAVGFGAGEESH